MLQHLRVIGIGVGASLVILMGARLSSPRIVVPSDLRIRVQVEGAAAVHHYLSGLSGLKIEQLIPDYVYVQVAGATLRLELPRSYRLRHDGNVIIEDRRGEASTQPVPTP